MTKIIDLNSYDNLLSSIEMTYLDVEEKIKDYPLKFLSVRNKKVEFGIRFPMFVPSFYNYILEKNEIPNQSQFWDFYLTQNVNFFKDKNYSDEIMEGLQARVYRTYPSLIRDLHFCLFMKGKSASNINANVIYNIKLDVEEGIDILFQFKDKLYGINLYTDTYRSKTSKKL